MRGFVAIGVMHSKKEVNIGTLFRTAHSFGAAYVFTVGQRYDRQASDTTKAYRHMPLFRFDSLDDLRHHLPFGCPLVGVELAPNAIPLQDYEHRQSACYLLGAEDHGLTAEELAACHEVVQLPGTYCLNVAVAGSIVLYDRLTKAESTAATLAA